MLNVNRKKQIPSFKENNIIFRVGDLTLIVVSRTCLAWLEEDASMVGTSFFKSAQVLLQVRIVS